ncbi:hypothetical protein tb265_44980 [Gemmatimonadetes bacterium T265]|nr:hypothetical protein tb265_44980 [Gemmatimonadetes bacterium T265]
MPGDALGAAYGPRPERLTERGEVSTAPGAAEAPVPDRVTDRLRAWGAGDRGALDALLPVLYAELRRQAVRAMRRERDGHTLNATALVHEVYLRLARQPGEPWRNRAQFFGAAAYLMRQVLVDYARTRQAAKRGGGAWQITLGHAADVAAGADGADGAADVLAVHAALERLAAFDPPKARSVEVRYFGGLTLEETAVVLGVSVATVKREWAVARAWLQRELGAISPTVSPRHPLVCGVRLRGCHDTLQTRLQNRCEPIDVPRNAPSTPARQGWRAVAPVGGPAGHAVALRVVGLHLQEE